MLIKTSGRNKVLALSAFIILFVLLAVFLYKQLIDLSDYDIVYDFTEDFPFAQISPDQIPAGSFDIPVESEMGGFFQPTDTLVTFYTHISEGAVLSFGLQCAGQGESEDAWGFFRIYIETEDSQEKLLFQERLKSNTTKIGRLSWNKIRLSHHSEKLAKISFEFFKDREKSTRTSAVFGKWVSPTLYKPKIEKQKHQHPVFSGRKKSKAIIIYLIDALRADHMSCYGYERKTTPNIDGFAKDAVVFENTIAQATWTRPAVTSLFTGTHQTKHNVTGRNSVLAEGTNTLASILKEKGFVTASFNSNGNVDQSYGVLQGYEYIASFYDKANISSQLINEELFPLLEKRSNEDQPFHLYIHTNDPHSPYEPDPAFRIFSKDYGETSAGSPEREKDRHQRRLAGISEEEMAEVEALYDDEILHNDYHFGKLLERLKAWNLYDNAMIILTADHGEELYDHECFGHGWTVYNEVAHIPLIFKLPGNSAAGQRISSLIRQIDIAPTIIDYLGIDIPDSIEGESFLNLIANGQYDQSEMRMITETKVHDIHQLWFP